MGQPYMEDSPFLFPRLFWKDNILNCNPTIIFLFLSEYGLLTIGQV